MADATAPAPAQLVKDVFEGLQEKAALPMRSLLVLGLLAGAYIGLGGLFSTLALSGADALPHGMAQVVAGLVFATGLALVIIAGAELFTGNLLMAGPIATGQLGVGQAARALAVVYCANFIGSVLLAAVVLAAHVHEAGDGAVAQAALSVADTKTGNPFLMSLASGILANMLVCLAVWMAYAGQTVTQKIAGLLLPVAAFVAAGLEHSVANMYLLPYAWMVQEATGDTTANLTLANILGNIVPATLGNIIGGALVALAYWQAYHPEKDDD